MFGISHRRSGTLFRSAGGIRKAKRQEIFVSCLLAFSDTFAHAFAEFCAEALKIAVVDAVAYLLHQMVVEPEVMHDQQP